jgi:L-fuculokinase
VCGIHDSNASYLQHLLDRRHEPFCVVSSGTWTVIMANRADLSALRAERDMLANVDAFGAPVGTARFMGGREYEAIARTADLPTLAGVNEVMTRCSLVMPALAKGGPFAAWPGTLLRADELRPPERAALATLYVALMSDLLIELLGAEGDILIDGPLAVNPLYGSLLATWSAGRRVFAAGASGGYASAVCFLAGFPDVPAPPAKRLHPLELAALREYRAAWRESLPTRLS